ncbi:MAG: N-acetylmannosamine-6-phosphate 2-epimerase, partial [Pseudonocardia sp.]
ATTLAGYLDGAVPDGPDLDLVSALRSALPGVPVIAEGRYHRAEQAVAALRAGATSVVVGTAITDPVWITRSFATTLGEAGRG